MLSHQPFTDTTLRALLTLALVLTEVGLWQWRVLLTNRGARAVPALLGVVGAVLQVTAIAQVVTNTGDPLMVAAYAVGVGGGVFVGVVVAGRTAPAPVDATVVPAEPAPQVTTRRPVLRLDPCSGTVRSACPPTRRSR